LKAPRFLAQLCVVGPLHIGLGGKGPHPAPSNNFMLWTIRSASVGLAR
jgi:hypothetical protein